MASIVKRFATSGYVVDVEVKTIQEQPMLAIVDLDDTSVKEARERVHAAFMDRRYNFPAKKIVINQAHSDLNKSGSHFDLAMALGAPLGILSGQTRPQGSL